MQVFRTGTNTTQATVDLSSTDGTAKQKGDYTNAVNRIVFEPGVTQKNVPVLVCEDAYAEGPESFTLTLSNPTGGSTLGAVATTTVQIVDDATETSGNPIDEARGFVCQQYHDFLNRQSDQAGEDFWTNQIASCGNDAACIDEKRTNVSAAFFLSIEFQNTGYLVIRAHKAAFGSEKSNPRYAVFLRDQREINEGVIVGQPDADARLEQNMQKFFEDFVQRPEFVTHFPMGRQQRLTSTRCLQTPGGDADDGRAKRSDQRLRQRRHGGTGRGAAQRRRKQFRLSERSTTRRLC